MKIREIMTTDVRACTPDTNLASVAALMLDGDCGILPVEAGGKLVGVVTDRDAFIALGTRNVRASDLQAGQVMQEPVHTCGPDDDVQEALDAMRQHRVRRLVVEGFGGTVAGIVSMNDLLLAAGARKAIRDTDVAEAFRTICAHNHPAPHVAVA